MKYCDMFVTGSNIHTMVILLKRFIALLYVVILITSLVCPGFTQAIVQFDKSIFTLGVNPLSGDLTIGKLELH